MSRGERQHSGTKHPQRSGRRMARSDAVARTGRDSPEARAPDTKDARDAKDARDGHETPPKPSDATRASDFLANERTFLAWLRTAVALIALGFVVARFGLLLRELAANAAGVGARLATNHLSSIFGSSIVVLAAALLVLAYVRYRRNDQALRRGAYTSDRLLTLAVAALVVVIALLLAAYLLLTS